jgi:hypothetical protein
VTEVVVDITKNEAFEKLEKLTSKMDVPKYNTRKAQWLAKNLAARNSNHPSFPEAKQLVDLILEKGWQ